MSYVTQTDNEIRENAHKGGGATLFVTLAAIAAVCYLIQSIVF